MNENNKITKIALISFISSTPFFLSIFVVFIATFFVLGLFDGDGSSGGGGVANNLPVIDDICESITVEGIGPMSIDEYVVGVVLGEVGMFTGHPEILKANSIAARTYVLYTATKDGNGNCIIPNGEGTQVYKEQEDETDDVIEEIKKLVEETSGMILIDENNNIINSEFDSILLVEAYDLSGTNVTLKQQNLEIPKEWLLEVKEPERSCPIDGKEEDSNDLNRYREKYDGYGCGHGRGMSQWGGLYLEMEKSYNYIEILNFFYGSNTQYNCTLASINEYIANGSSSNNGNFSPLTSYNLNHKGLTKLNRLLTEIERNTLNNYIQSSIDKAGYGTGEAVAAAGQALTHGLEQMGYYLGYYWGGDRNSMGVGKQWGYNKGYAYTAKGNPTGPYFGMDCSGFVSWAIRNACDPSYSGDDHIANFNKQTGMDHGPHISIKSAKPGDLVLKKGHVKLVIKNNGDGSIIVAEEAYGPDGLVFKKNNASDVSAYKIIDMGEYYSTNCKVNR